MVAATSAREHTRSSFARATSPKRSPTVVAPHRAPDPAHRAGAALPALAAGARRRASRSCSPARAPTRCSPATISSARRKVRRFWAREPSSQLRPLLLERLYPYLARSPVAQRAMAQAFFGAGPRAATRPTSRTCRAGARRRRCKRLFARELRDAIGDATPSAALVATLPDELRAWAPLAQDQYLEMRTLLSGYLLSSQGDRVAMAHSVEGRFPFLDADVVELATRCPPTTSCASSTRSTSSSGSRARSRAARRSSRGPKQPYRAPDALVASSATARPPGSTSRCARARVARRGLRAGARREALWRSARAREDEAQLSNADNMALVGVLSTQLLQHELHPRRRSRPASGRRPRTRSNEPSELEHGRDPAAARLPRSNRPPASPTRSRSSRRAQRSPTPRSTRARTGSRTPSRARRRARRSRRRSSPTTRVETVVRVLGVPQGERGRLDRQPADARPTSSRTCSTTAAPRCSSTTHIANVWHRTPSAASPHSRPIVISGEPNRERSAGLAFVLGRGAGRERDAPPRAPQRSTSTSRRSSTRRRSTGEPKGVMLTHRNMLTAATSITTLPRDREDDVILVRAAARVRLRPLPDDHGVRGSGARLVLERSFAFPARS